MRALEKTLWAIIILVIIILAAIAAKDYYQMYYGPKITKSHYVVTHDWTGYHVKEKS